MVLAEDEDILGCSSSHHDRGVPTYVEFLADEKREWTFGGQPVALAESDSLDRRSGKILEFARISPTFTTGQLLDMRVHDEIRLGLAVEHHRAHSGRADGSRRLPRESGDDLITTGAVDECGFAGHIGLVVSGALVHDQPTGAITRCGNEPPALDAKIGEGRRVRLRELHSDS